METVALLGLAGLGYLLAKTSTPSKTSKPSKNEGFIAGSQPSIPSIPPRPFPPGPLLNRKTGGSAVGTSPELDLMYKTPDGKMYPSEPNPGPYGTPLGYASQKPEHHPPVPQTMEAFKSSVAMNPPGVEKNPVYGDKETFITSALTGERMLASDFNHNNMVPFFKGSVKQNMAPNTNTSILDSYNGTGSTDLKKKEVETMFNTSQTPFGNPFGLENSTAFFQSRIEEPRNRANEKSFEPIRVGSAVGEKFGTTGKGGFQQFEVDEIMKRAMPTTEKLRVATNPKESFKTPVVPGQRFITSGPNNPGEVRKYKPDTFYIDETGERFIGAFSEESQRESTRPIQVLNYVTRPETSSEFIGTAAAQESGKSYVVSDYRTPMSQQYGGAGFRNADMTTYYTKDVGSSEADYGKSSFEIRPNERLSTENRTMGLNLAPADMGASYIRVDDVRPTRRAETVGNIRQTATPVGYAGGVPAITVWDPSDVARTTIKETTINWGLLGIASPADAPARLTVYDPDDIARPTQKSQLSAKSEYFGGGNAVRKDSTSHEAAYNMRLNPNKEQIAKGRKPFAGNGGLATMNGTVNQTSKKLDADGINDRSMAVNNVVGMPPGTADIGQVKYRLPLKMDISLERNQPAMVAAVENNPLQQSLRRNAEHDQRVLEENGRYSTSGGY